MPTPLEQTPLGGRDIYLKREDIHERGAFKWRGALPALELYRASGAKAVVTVSTGGRSPALAARVRRELEKALSAEAMSVLERMQAGAADVRPRRGRSRALIGAD